MAQIRNKLKKAEYSHITDLTADLYLMIDNAKKAFPPTHKVHKVCYKSSSTPEEFRIYAHVLFNCRMH